MNYQFEIRFALGEVEMKSGKTSSGVAHLRSLEIDATAKGFLLIAHKANVARAGTVSVSSPAVQRKVDLIRPLHSATCRGPFSPGFTQCSLA